MDDIRKVIKKTSPPAVVLQTLRTSLTLPSAAARTVINDLTKPIHDQRRFVKKFDNEHWKGSLIMSEMIRCDDQVAIERLKRSDIVIFEVHGGGFRVGNSTMYMESFVSWLRMLKSKHNVYGCIMSIEYGLAPKFKYPIPLHETLKAYQYLTQDLGVSPNRIIFSGDSAGGALCLETLMRTYAPNIIKDLDAPRENMQPIPAGLLLSSPLVTAETTSDSWKKFEKTDMVSNSLVKLIHKEFLGLPERDPEELPILRLSHVRSKFDRFLPKHVMVFVGSKEVMRDDILELAKTVEQDGSSQVTLYEEKYAHDWFLIHEIVKKKDKMMLKRYDELFVDFAVKAVREAISKASGTTSATASIKLNTIQDILLPPIVPIVASSNIDDSSDSEDVDDEKNQKVDIKENFTITTTCTNTNKQNEDAIVETVSLNSEKKQINDYSIQSEKQIKNSSKEHDTILSAYKITMDKPKRKMSISIN